MGKISLDPFRWGSRNSDTGFVEIGSIFKPSDINDCPLVCVLETITNNMNFIAKIKINVFIARIPGGVSIMRDGPRVDMNLEPRRFE